MALEEQASREHLFGDGGSGPSVVRSMVTEAATVYVGGKVVGAVVSRAAPVVQRMAGRVAGVGTGQVVPPTAVMQQSAPLGGAGAAPRPLLAERLSAAIERGGRAAPPAPRPVPAAAPSTRLQRHVMFEGEGTGVGAAPIPVSRPATTATLTTAPASSTGGGNVPGIDKPFRPANPAHPPNAAVVERMNSLQPHHNMDCSEIADTLQRTAGGGRILHVTGRGGKDLKLFENGQISAPEFAYHQVFTDGRYIYDPLLSKTAVPLGDWECFIRTLNPGALIK